MDGEENFCSFILKDKDDAEIPLDNLVNIVGQFSGCACFVIKIDRFDKEQPGAVGENLKQHNAAIGSDVVIHKEVSLSNIHIIFLVCDIYMTFSFISRA